MPRASRSSKGPALPGVDIIEVGRIERLARRSPRFLRRVYTEEEIRYCRGKKRRWQHFAVRFAAKEAVWKALGGGVSLRDIGVRSLADGSPRVTIRGRIAPGVRVSLSHCEHYALAFAIVQAPAR